MPELPEVEVVRRGLEPVVVGKTIERVRVLHPRSVRRHSAGPADFEDRLADQRVVGASRRGKYLWLPLGSGDAVLAHLGMSGQLLVQRRAATPERHLRVAFELSQGHDLRFVDQRTFGGLLISDGGADLPREIGHIARDPIDMLFDDAVFGAGLRRRRTGVKRALLDQTLISGVGNIYADEALWRARLHWARPTAALTRPQARTVLGAAAEAMTEAVRADCPGGPPAVR